MCSHAGKALNSTLFTMQQTHPTLHLGLNPVKRGNFDESTNHHEQLMEQVFQFPKLGPKQDLPTQLLPTVATIPSVSLFQYSIRPSVTTLPTLPPVPDNSNAFVSACSSMIVANQNMISEICEKEDNVERALFAALRELSALKKVIHPVSSTKADGTLAVTSELSTSETLLNMLCPNHSAQPFEYSLVIKGEIPTTLYRERYFNLDLTLIDNTTGAPVINFNKLVLQLQLFTSENTPKPLTFNTSGNPAIKGVSEVEMVGGRASFDKVQINEVSSHFMNGWLFLAIVPKPTGNQAENLAFLSNYTSNMYIDPRKIKPLVMDKVIVKAKKMK